MSKCILGSLKRQMFCAVWISLLFGAAVFGAVFFLGNILLDKTVYGQTFAKRMADRQFSKLQDYVNEESVSLQNLQRLNVWCSRGEKVYLTIYDEDVIVYESPMQTQTVTESEPDASKFDIDEEDPENEYILTLAGNKNVCVFLYYYAGEAFYFWMTVLSGVAAFFIFSVCFVMFVNRKIAYISLLKKELDILSGGQLEYQVTIQGKDELSELASGIDQMRCSIMTHQKMENQMRSSNMELITAMSHDLRTPLTSLLAYLEIIERKKYADEEQMDQLIHKSVAQTMRIKNMANKLFEYFLVYATEWEYSEMETVDADGLFEAILEDYAYSIENKGMIVERDFCRISGQIKVNMELLHRALDNLYSNLLKYADFTQPVRFAYKREKNCFCLTITNGIRLECENRESTSIGLNTCRRIMQYHGGNFSVTKDEHTFAVKMELPLLE